VNKGQRWINLGAVAAVLVAFALIFVRNAPGNITNQLLNVSYDPTRELYTKVDADFAAAYEFAGDAADRRVRCLLFLLYCAVPDGSTTWCENIDEQARLNGCGSSRLIYYISIGWIRMSRLKKWRGQ
jgi:hypothetical protein